MAQDISNSFPHHHWGTLLWARSTFNEQLLQNATEYGVWFRVDESSPEEHIDERENLDAAEDAADRFGVHNDEIRAPNLDAQKVEHANDEQAHCRSIGLATINYLTDSLPLFRIHPDLHL